MNVQWRQYHKMSLILCDIAKKFKIYKKLDQCYSLFIIYSPIKHPHLFFCTLANQEIEHKEDNWINASEESGIKLEEHIRWEYISQLYA